MSENTKGRFEIGGKPGPGAPRGNNRLPEDVREFLRDATMPAAKRMVDALDAMKSIVVSDGEAGSHIDNSEPDHDMRMKAAIAIMDRRYGKPVTAISGPDGEPFRLDVNAIADSLKKLAGE